jgi:phosphatidylglycerol:prolipoprotein diacylglycerol transferase
VWPKIGPIYTYGILYVAGIVTHFIVSDKISKWLGVRRRVWVAISICYLVGMTFGAKLLYDIHQSQFSIAALFSIQHYLSGGLWGGLLAYLVLAVPAALLLATRKYPALDLVALSVPVPWIFAKIGCLLNACCYGRTCKLPWAITFPEGSTDAPAGVSLHPTQIYEVLIMVGIIIIFRALKYDRWKGAFLFWFLALYGFGRAATDIFRGDVDRYVYVGPFTLTQLFCLCLAVVSTFILCFRSRVWPD